MSSLAKREAALAAQAAPRQPADESAVRTWPISVHLTPLAPGCSREAIDSKRRWRTFYGATPAQVVTATLKRLKLAARAVQAEGEVNGDVLLLAPVPANLQRWVTDAPELAPFAVIWDGLDLDQVRAELAALAARNWTPPLEDAA